jgi:hypothetical protein
MSDSEPISGKELGEWEKLADAAHRGPWFVRHGTNPDYPHGVEVGYPQQVLSEGDVHLIGEFYDGTDVAPAVHAPFVAAARTAVPALIAEVRQLRLIMEGSFLLARNEELYRRVQELTRQLHRNHVNSDPDCELCEDDS